MGLLTNGITRLLMKTIFRGTAERIDNMIDLKGKDEVIKASNEFKETVVKLRKTLDDPEVRKELEQAGVQT